MLLTLTEAALLIRPDGLVSARSLRAEIAAGRLSCHRIAGRIMVSNDDLAAYLDRARHGTAPAPRQKPAKPSAIAAARSSTPEPKPQIPGPLAAATAALKRSRTVKRAG